MLKREIEEKLKEWKRNSDKKCLIISGARQVGKTYIVEKFAKENYENFIEINFVENPTAKKYLRAIWTLILFLPICLCMFKRI